MRVARFFADLTSIHPGHIRFAADIIRAKNEEIRRLRARVRLLEGEQA